MAYTQAVDIENKALRASLGATLLVTARQQQERHEHKGPPYGKCILAQQRSMLAVRYRLRHSSSRKPSYPDFPEWGGSQSLYAAGELSSVGTARRHSAGVTNQGTSAGTRWGDYSVEGPILLTAKATSVLLRYVASWATVTTCSTRLF